MARSISVCMDGRRARGTGRGLVSACLVLLLGAFPLAASAYSFMPTLAEWAAWPAYCKGRYVTTNIGAASEFRPMFPPEAVEEQRHRIGAETFEHVHHYCAGVAWLNRARVESGAERKDYLLREALGEAQYTAQRIPSDSPVMGPVTITLARIYMEKKDFGTAARYFEEGIRARPNDAMAYSAYAVMYRSQKQLDKAKQVLLDGDAATEGRSAEIQYNLGLLMLDLGDVDSAVAYARKAYALGFPLPGLRNKLQRMGRSLADGGSPKAAANLTNP